MEILQADIKDIDEIYALIRNVYDEFVAPDYTPDGNNEFYNFIDKDYMLLRLKEESVIYAAKDRDKIIGVIEVRRISHISLLYVDKNHQRQGLAKRLFSHVRMINKCAEYTVNSSVYAYAIYQKIGFIKQQDDFVQKNGIRYMPMIFRDNAYALL